MSMSIDSRRVEQVFAVMQTVAENGDGSVQVGAVADVLRDSNSPISAWQIRADCSALQERGRIHLDAASGAWRISAGQQEQGAA